ncbi:MAG: C40 family peptidase [Lachnospiraceae bacterium]|nr:C40 family peptidase [Lachnospiraceae bacterium]
MKICKGVIQVLCCVGITAALYWGSIQKNAVPVAATEIKTETYENVEIISEEPVITAEPEPTETSAAEVKNMEEQQATAAPEHTEEAQDTGEYVDFAIADVNHYVNVRSIPSTEGEIVGKIYDGAVAQIVEITGEDNDWFQIISGNVEGYVKGEYFIHGEEAAAVMDSYVVSSAVVQVKKLNVRAEQSSGAMKLGYLENGETARILENLGEWIKIQYTADTDGYIAAEYVSVAEAYSYAKTLEEESAEREIDTQRESRKPAEKKVEEVAVEEILEVVAPSVTYTSNEELRRSIIDYALQYVGNKYVSGGSSLTTGTDCSGFTCFIFAEFGYSISRTPSGQYSGAGRSIDLSEVQPGDIVCYSSNGGKSCTHVAFYMGDGKIVHSANSRKGVITSDIDFEPIIGVRNVID